MDNTNLALFVVASWILVVTPGPDMLYVITRGISQGRKSGVVSAIGVTLGILGAYAFCRIRFCGYSENVGRCFRGGEISGSPLSGILGRKDH